MKKIVVNAKLLRAIDDILNDIKGDISIKSRNSFQNSQNLKDILSSLLLKEEQYQTRDLSLSENARKNQTNLKYLLNRKILL